MKEFKVYCKPHERKDVLKMMLNYVEGSEKDEDSVWTDLTVGYYIVGDGRIRTFEDGSSTDYYNTLQKVTPDRLKNLIQTNLDVEVDNTPRPVHPQPETVNDVIREQIIEKNVPGLTPERLLQTAAETIGNRAASRDTDAERSMARTVNIFNAMTGLTLTERLGWEFMIALKLARGQQGGFNDDDYVDLAGYTALLAEHLCSLE